MEPTHKLSAQAKKSSKARAIRKANVIYCLSIPGTGLVICEHTLFWLDAQLLCKKDDDNFHENLVHHTINAKQRHNILHIFFYYFVRNIYFKIELAKTNSCSESLPVHEQSSSNIYQIVGLPLEKRKNKTKKVLCLDTRSHMQNAKCHLLLHQPLCYIGKFLSHWKHLHPIQRLRD